MGGLLNPKSVEKKIFLLFFFSASHFSLLFFWGGGGGEYHLPRPRDLSFLVGLRFSFFLKCQGFGWGMTPPATVNAHQPYCLFRRLQTAFRGLFFSFSPFFASLGRKKKPTDFWSNCCEQEDPLTKLSGWPRYANKQKNCALYIHILKKKNERHQRRTIFGLKSSYLFFCNIFPFQTSAANTSIVLIARVRCTVLVFWGSF